MRRTANQQRIFALQGQLPDTMPIIESHQYDFVDYDLLDCAGAHNCTDAIVSCAIDDYQVFRCYDVEFELADLYEKAMDILDGLPEDERKNIEHDIDGWLDSQYNELLMEGEDVDFEIGEYKQLWWNVKTGEVVHLGRICKKEPIYCDFNAKWAVLTPHSKSEMVQQFMNRHRQENFFSANNYGFYYDYSVHPTIQSWGYDGIDAFNWSCHCGEDEQHSDESNLYLAKCEDWIGFMRSFEHGNEFDSITKPYGFHTYIMLQQLEGKLKDDYFAAVKIARRNHYTIADQGMWDDMVKALSTLGKDCHNAHYVCPEDFQKAHDHWTAKMAAEQEKQRVIKQLEEAKEYAAAYIERISKYLDIRLQNSNFDIFVCPSVEAMQEEGLAMHHCVFSMGYYKPDKKSLILLVRDKQGKRIATTELRTDTWKIEQTRGACNKAPEYQGNPCLDEINELIKKNVKYFKDPDKWATRKAKVIKLNPSAESVPTPSVALAA